MLAVVHLYPPLHNAGAEIMLHALLRDLVARGWDVRVLATQYRGEPYERDGVSVARAPVDIETGEHFAWCDVAITHLDATRRAVGWARWGRPLVHVVHNHRQLVFHKVRPAQAQLVVWNSEWLQREAKSWRGHPSLVVRPPVRSADYATERSDDGAATLLNLYPPKGADTFWRLVDELPRHRFLGVLGSYGGQRIPERVPSNAEVIPNTPDVVERVYARTRVLLMPSRYESWGRAAVEAMASGIPVIAAPTLGLVEALTSPRHGECALFVDAADVDGWAKALRELDDERTYEHWSKRARQRSDELDRQAVVDLDAFAEAMLSLAS